MRHWHPTPAQTLILRAALEPPEAARAAWREWGGDLARLDAGTARLLPLVAANVGDPALAGVRRRAWADHADRLRRSLPFVAALAAEVPVLFLKGVALAPLYYGDLGLRPLSDVDLLVRRDDVPRVVGLLRRLGLAPEPTCPRSLAPALAGETNLADEGYQHSVPFVAPDGLEVDLHWAVMYPNVGPRSDDALWRRAVPFSVGGASGFTLCATDHLLHVIVHGLSFSDSSTVRWIADAMFVLRAAGGVDWEILLEEARARRLELPLREALGWLVDCLDAPVPRWVLARLASARISVLARLRYADLLQDWGAVRHPGVLAGGVARFTEGRGWVDALRVAGRYFVHRVDPRGVRYAARQVLASLRLVGGGEKLNNNE